MKNLSLLLVSIFIIILTSTSSLMGQTTGDFRSAQSGNWGDVLTWQTWNGSAWIAAASTPDSISSVAVTIVSPHNVTIAATVAVRNVTVNTGATITANGDSVILYITQEGMTVNGTLILTGNVPTAAPFSITKTTGTLTIGNGGVINYNQTGTTKPALPSTTWLTGSTLNVNSIGAVSSTGWNAGGNQNFYNINWNVSTQTGSFGWGFTSATIGGTYAILNTNTGRVQFFGGSSGTLNIMGDLIVSGAANATNNGTSSGTNDTLNIYGKINVNTTGNFAISRGSQGTVGTAIWNLYGDSVKIIAGTMQNSNSTPDGAKFIFKKNGIQYFSLVPTVLTGNATPIEIGAGATVSLTSPVNVTTLYLNGGIIVSTTANPLIMGWWNGSTLTSGTVSVTAPGSSTSYISGPMAYLYLTAGSTTKTYPIGKGANYSPLSLSFTQSTATISTYTAESFNTAPPTMTLPGSLDKVSTVRYYKIAENGSGSAITAVSVALNYNVSDGVSDTTNLRIAQGPGSGSGTWTDLGGTGSGSPVGKITSTVSFSDLASNNIFTLANHTGGSNPLPVELSSFSVSSKSRSVQINWKTSTEKNSSMFEIECASVKSNGGSLTWTTSGTVPASGTSTSIKNYSFTDNNLQSGKYLYRLKMIDYDGTFKLSSIVETEIALPKNFDLSQNYPNPFNPSTKIDYSLPSDSKIVLEIYNINGARVSQLVNEEQTAGYYSVDFNSSVTGKIIPSGVYLYRLSAVDKTTGNNYSVVKKMMLLK
jgi:hypothetical protein